MASTPDAGGEGDGESSGCSTILMVIGGILLFPLILAVGILAVLFLFLFMACRYNCEIEFMDNLICAALYWVVLLVPEQTEMEQTRANFIEPFKQWLSETKPNVEYSTFKVQVDYDNTQVDVYRTVPKGKNPEELAMFIYFHGGGMKTGQPLDATFKEHVETYGDELQMITIDYGLTLNGHKYPKGIEDCMAVIREMAPKTPHLMLSGVSSGGYLTMATGLRCRDEGIPVKHLVPMSANIHCGVDELSTEALRMSSGSICGKANAVSKEFLVHCWKELFLKEEDYVTKADKGHDHRTWDYSGLPPCDVCAGSFDFSCADGMEYRELMLKAGVDARLHTVRATHAYFDMQMRPVLGPILDDIFLAYPRKTSGGKGDQVDVQVSVPPEV